MPPFVRRETSSRPTRDPVCCSGESDVGGGTGIRMKGIIGALGAAEGHKGIPAQKGETGCQEVRGRRPAPAFALTEQEGRPLSLHDLRGKVVVDVCPVQTAKAVAAQRALPPAGRDRVHLLLIASDPAMGTPAVLKGYATRFGAEYAP